MKMTSALFAPFAVGRVREVKGNRSSLSTEEVHFGRAERSRCSAVCPSGKTEKEKSVKQSMKPAGPAWIHISVTEQEKEKQLLPKPLSEELMWSFLI